MLRLSEQDVRGLLSIDKALELVEAAFQSLGRGTAYNQPRRRVIVPGGATLHVMAAADAATGYLGTKIYSTSRQGTSFLVLLYRADTGQPLAQMEADYLGQARTGAATGVATRHMARPDASVLAVIGAGGQARTQVQAVARVRRLSEIRVFSRTPAHRTDFAGWAARETGVAALAVDSAEAAVRGSHIVVTITNSRSPVLLGQWLEPGMHINAAGGNMANRRELDEAAIARADLIAADSVEQARIESGELIASFGASRSGWARVVEFSDIAAGKRPGRDSPQQITLFKSNGIALQDVAVAAYLYEVQSSKSKVQS